MRRLEGGYLRVGRIAGAPLRVHLTTPLGAAAFAFAAGHAMAWLLVLPVILSGGI